MKNEAITFITKKWLDYFLDFVIKKKVDEGIFPMVWFNIHFNKIEWFSYSKNLYWKRYKIKEIIYTFDDYVFYLNDSLKSWT